jgi:signal-transduction protein with cAMP-binding, CBS, and nucleotidyltransferase domain
MKTGYKVCDAMTKTPTVISIDATIEECAKIMNQNKVGSLLVKNHKLMGIITDQDIVRKIIAEGINPSKALVQEHMTKKLLTITPDKDIFEAITIMSNENIKQLPVMNGDQMVGLLTQKDILRLEPELFDLLVDKLEIKEEEHKPHLNEGNCESCGQYSEKLLTRDDELLCKNCAK